MADKRKKPKGGRRCVAGAPNKTSCGNSYYTEGITMHSFPSDPVIRAQWVRFVQRHRVDFSEPVNKHACLCSAHFEDSCFTRDRSIVEVMTEVKMRRILIKGSVPTRDTVSPPNVEVLTERKRRQLKRDALSTLDDQPVVKKPRRQLNALAEGAGSNTPNDSVSVNSPPLLICPLEDVDPSPLPAVATTVSTPAAEPYAAATPLLTPVTSTDKCSACLERSRKCSTLRKGNLRLRRKVAELKQTIRELQSRVVETEEETVVTEEELEDDDRPNTDQPHMADAETTCDSSDDENNIEEEREDVDWTYASVEESTESESNMDEDPEEFASNDVRVDPNMPEYDQPKFIVFYWKLVNLFSMFCFLCKEADPNVTVKSLGTMVTLTQHCLKCNQRFEWQSQPTVHGKTPAGNLLLSFAILMAGACINKTMLIFHHMGLSVHAGRTYFRHQHFFLFPTILKYWEIYRDELVRKLEKTKDVVWTGDGRFDSMGHSAKFGVYTMLCTTIMKIVHFEVVQANETGGSQQTELEGCKRCFAFLKQLGLTVSVFISDRHRGIAKWIRDSCTGTKHYFDIWHVARSITKKLLKASKEKGCEIIASWIKGIRKHLYWCATSTKTGFGSLISAKWLSFLRHVANKHTDHPNPLYVKCCHGDLERRQWIRIGTAAYDKLHGLLTNKTLVNDIKQLSSEAQTSCLEGFHATLNHWHPKMTCFSWLGTFCRHVLASLHFNENVQRQSQTGANGEQYLRVSYPKYKYGEEVVRDVKTPATYGYVNAMKKLMFSLSRTVMNETFKRYSAKDPGSLASQFPDRLGRTEAVKVYKQQKQKHRTQLFPSRDEQTTLQQTAMESVPAKCKAPRKASTCRTCKKPMRGHSKSKCQSET